MNRPLLLVLLAACGDNLLPAPPPGAPEVVRVFRAADLPGCTTASPVVVAAAGEQRIVVATSEGAIAAYGLDGALRWMTTLPAPEGRRAWVAATPAVVDDRIVVAWQVADRGRENRDGHQAAVLDAVTGALDPQFPIATLTASVAASDGSGDVVFNAPTAFSRSALAHARAPGDSLGRVYVSTGNRRDIQPWHGWVFELHLDAWRTGGPTPSAVLLTTPEPDCGRDGESGADDMICGGGVWGPSGPVAIPRGDSFELLVPTGNGQLDLARRDYANTIMRTGPGLGFDPACDPVACAGFDPLAPAEACLASCRNLFVPRLRAGDAALAPPDQLCDGLTFLECYAALDLDLGASSPAQVVLPSGRAVLVLPAKDGAVYAIDAERLGPLLDRRPLLPFCGSGGGRCEGHWAGTMVTEPLIVPIDGEVLALIPSFYFDHTNPAGVVALAVVEAGETVQLEERWRAPRGDEAVERFRYHTGRLARIDVAGEPYAALVDPDEDGRGRLYLLRVRDGMVAARRDVDGPGQKYIEPAVVGERVFVTSCQHVEDGPSHLEGWDVIAVP